MHKKNCFRCGDEFSEKFYSKIINKKYCSKGCRYSAAGNQKQESVCRACDNKFYFYTSSQKNRAHCSIQCKSIWKSYSVDKKIGIVKDRFERFVIRQNGCWGWSGPITPAGYGSMLWNNRLTAASRISWYIHYGFVDRSQWVLHKCDNPICTNPDHLFLGDCRANVEDMIKKGRQNIRRGEDRSIKLTNEKVISIRKLAAENMTHRHIANLYDIAISTVSSIIKRRSWKHI